jgi:high frequency lysogenization protein
LTRQLARTGKAEPSPFETSLRSLFIVEPKNIVDIYGNLADLRLGFEELLKVFDPSSNAPQDPEIRYYVISLMHLERTLAKDTHTDAHLTKRLSQAMTQVNYFSPTHPQVISNLADMYSESIGQFKYTIKIVGSAAYLNNREIMNKVRASLLAGIRAAVLWRQMRGSRLQLFFSRRHIVGAAKALLENPDHVL